MKSCYCKNVEFNLLYVILLVKLQRGMLSYLLFPGSVQLAGTQHCPGASLTLI